MNVGNEKKAKAEQIIHNFATAAATASAGLSQIPGADASTLTALYLGMAKKIAELFDKELDPQTTSTLLAEAVKYDSRVIAYSLGLIPLMGNIIRATSIFGSVKKIGWFFYNYFETHKGNP